MRLTRRYRQARLLSSNVEVERHSMIQGGSRARRRVTHDQRQYMFEISSMPYNVEAAIIASVVPGVGAAKAKWSGPRCASFEDEVAS